MPDVLRILDAQEYGRTCLYICRGTSDARICRFWLSDEVRPYRGHKGCDIRPLIPFQTCGHWLLRLGIVHMKTRACLCAPGNMESVISRNESKLLKSFNPNFIQSKKFKQAAIIKKKASNFWVGSSYRE